MASAPQPKVLKLTVINGSLMQAPVYEAHTRSKNWLARIDVDGTCPGGLSRKFLNTGRGQCLYDVEQLGLFEAIEFGADYITSMGKKHPKRWFGIVTAKTDDALWVEECSSGAAAVLRSKAARESKADRMAALRAQHDAAIAKAEQLQRELDELSAPDAPAVAS